MSDEHEQGQDQDWLDEPSLVAARAREQELAARPLSPLGMVAQQAADVSPAWAAVTEDPFGLDATPLPIARRDRAFGLESIREGWLLHRGASRVASGASPDLALLVGDWCYAAGLCAIADHGSPDDVAELATLVADVSARAAESVDEPTPRWNETVSSIASRDRD